MLQEVIGLLHKWKNRVKDVFYLFDRDRNGRIVPEEFNEGLQHMGLDLSRFKHKELKALFRGLESGQHQGYIDYHDMCGGSGVELGGAGTGPQGAARYAADCTAARRGGLAQYVEERRAVRVQKEAEAHALNAASSGRREAESALATATDAARRAEDACSRATDVAAQSKVEAETVGDAAGYSGAQQNAEAEQALAEAARGAADEATRAAATAEE
eukprot:5743499-Prymnesium_polylepis.1